MQTNNLISGTNMKICIKKSKTNEDISNDPFLTGFEYTILNNTNHIGDKKENVWVVEGRLKRVIFEDDVSNIVSFPDITLFDLCGYLSPPANEYEIEIEYVIDRKIKIKINDVDFYDYGHIFEANEIAAEEVYFVGTLDYTNIAKMNRSKTWT